MTAPSAPALPSARVFEMALAKSGTLRFRLTRRGFICLNPADGGSKVELATPANDNSRESNP
jgi:hypothetical protein